MSFFTPLSAAAIDNLLITEFVQAYMNLAPGQAVPSTNVGSTLGSAFRAVRTLALQLQNNQNAIESTARLQTSEGGDVDSFCQQFLVPRLAASAAQGSVTFACASPPPQQIVIPVNSVVQTTSGLQYTVIADNSQTGYNAGLNGYVIAANANPATVNATVVCNEPGTIGNVSAGAINTLVSAGGSPLPAVQSVTNAAGFTNGIDDEQDDPYKNRFMLKESGQNSGTNNAIAAALLGIQPGLTYSIGDLLSSSGQLQVAPQTTTTAGVAMPAVNAAATFPLTASNEFPFGAFVVVYDGTRAFYGQVTNLVDATHVAITNLATLVGSGTMASGATVLFVGSLAYFAAVVNVLGTNTGATPALIAAANAAIGGVVAAGTTFWVIGPTLVTVTPAATIHLPSSVDPNAAQAALNAAVETYINNIGLDPAGNSTICALGKIYSVLYTTIATLPGVGNGVANVDGLTLNAGTADITATFAQQLVCGTPAFTCVTP